MTTTVVDLSTGKTCTYTLSPKEAVIAAWEQDRGNWNTWTYEQSDAPMREGRFSFSAGDWVALKAQWRLA